jgi:hypothetical protein
MRAIPISSALLLAANAAFTDGIQRFDIAPLNHAHYIFDAASFAIGDYVEQQLYADDVAAAVSVVVSCKTCLGGVEVVQRALLSDWF